MKHRLTALLATTLLVLLGGCSLLEVKLESGVVPLPKEQLNMRVFTRDFASSFYQQVESSADAIMLEQDDDRIKANALMWKIYAEQGLQTTLYQASPVASMIDTWVYTAQMRAFFETGAGQALFGERQGLALEATRTLEAEFTERVKRFAKSGDFSKDSAFVSQYVAANPFTDIGFGRKSAFADWLAFRGIDESDAVTTFGSAPEVASDISDRLAAISSQTPKILGWKAELFAMHSSVDPKEIERTLREMADTAARFQALMAQSPEMMSQLAVDMRKELEPLLEKLGAGTDEKLARLSEERIALEAMVAREREALETMVARERANAAKDLEVITQKAVEVVFEQLTQTLKSLILYIVLFLLVVFFAPLGLGVWLGKRMALKKAQTV
jgi:hypothetical protein